MTIEEKVGALLAYVWFGNEFMQDGILVTDRVTFVSRVREILSSPVAVAPTEEDRGLLTHSSVDVGPEHEGASVGRMERALDTLDVVPGSLTRESIREVLVDLLRTPTSSQGSDGIRKLIEESRPLSDEDARLLYKNRESLYEGVAAARQGERVEGDAPDEAATTWDRMERAINAVHLLVPDEEANELYHALTALRSTAAPDLAGLAYAAFMEGWSSGYYHCSLCSKDSHTSPCCPSRDDDDWYASEIRDHLQEISYTPPPEEGTP